MQPRVTHLNCTRGEPAPANLVSDIAELLALPSELKAGFWTLLAPYLDERLAVSEAPSLVECCARVGVAPMELTHPLRAGRFLVHAAAKTDLDESEFVSDLSKLVDIHGIRELIAILVPCYERAFPILRRCILERTIAEHGKLVQDVALRIDSVASSSWGNCTEVPIAVLTFQYREGTERRITIHLLPEQLAELEHACCQLLTEAPDERH